MKTRKHEQFYQKVKHKNFSHFWTIARGAFYFWGKLRPLLIVTKGNQQTKDVVSHSSAMKSDTNLVNLITYTLKYK